MAKYGHLPSLYQIYSGVVYSDGLGAPRRLRCGDIEAPEVPDVVCLGDEEELGEDGLAGSLHSNELLEDSLGSVGTGAPGRFGGDMLKFGGGQDSGLFASAALRCSKIVNNEILGRSELGEEGVL
jgi:hypothetical protein